MLLLQKTGKHVLIPRLGIYFLYTTVLNVLKYLAFPDSITTQVVAALNKKKKKH